MEGITLSSLGLDVGSTTTNLRMSQTKCEWLDDRYVAVETSVLHEADTILTPYRSLTEIDAKALGDFLDQQIGKWGAMGRFDTGLVILTGLALVRHNAEATARQLSRHLGTFTTIAAGDRLECLLSAHGSGAVAHSRALGMLLLHVDIGGGTTKLTLCNKGEVQATAALDVGGRLVVTDDDGKIVQVAEPLHKLVCDQSSDLRAGACLPEAGKTALAERLAAVLVEVCMGRHSRQSELLMRMTDGSGIGSTKAVSFSGGVAEFIRGSESRDFNDLGAHLGAAVTRRFRDAGFDEVVLPERLRATVAAATERTTELSGSTVYVSQLAELPVTDVPVVRPRLDEHSDWTAAQVCRVVTAALRTLPREHVGAVALSYGWHGSATIDRLHQFCSGLAHSLASFGHADTVVLVGEADVAGLIGAYLCEDLELPQPVISIDGVDASDLDHIDVGQVLGRTGALPVTVKSLAFDSNVSVPHERQVCF